MPSKLFKISKNAPKIGTFSSNKTNSWKLKLLNSWDIFTKQKNGIEQKAKIKPISSISDGIANPFLSINVCIILSRMNELVTEKIERSFPKISLDYD